MVHINFSNQHIFSQGVWRGIQASFLGSFVFSVILSITFGWLEQSLEAILPIMMGSLFLFWFLFCLTVIPNIMGGMLLVWAINKLSAYKPVHVDDAVLIGFVLGAVITAGVEALGLAIFWLMVNAEKPNQIFHPFADPLLNAYLLGGIFLGGLVGGYVGQRFMRHLLTKQEKLLASAAADVHFTAETD
jgi:hypothetical protein